MMNDSVLRIPLIFFWIQFHYCINLSGCFEWKQVPSPVTFAKIRFPLEIRWEYALSTSETFSTMKLSQNSSTIYVKDKLKEPFMQNKDTNASFQLSGDRVILFRHLNITKEDRGKYCLQITYKTKRGARSYVAIKKNCIFLKPFALPRITLYTSNVTGKQNESVIVQCDADGYPAPRVKWIHKPTNKIIANSSATLIIISKESEGQYCCEVTNEFGNDTECASIKVREMPDIVSHSKVNITMTTNEITLYCNATGIPRPTIVWYDEERGKNSSSNDGKLKIIDTSCENKTSRYFCKAQNAVGESPPITVVVLRYCKDVNQTVVAKDDNGSFHTSTHVVLIVPVAVVCGLVMAVVITVYTFISRKKKHAKRRAKLEEQEQSPNKSTEMHTDMESPYGEPIDAIDAVNVNYTSASDTDYATVNETGYKRDNAPYYSKRKMEPVYAKVNKARKKKGKSTDVPLDPLYDEISDKTKSTAFI